MTTSKGRYFIMKLRQIDNAQQILPCLAQVVRPDEAHTRPTCHNFKSLLQPPVFHGQILHNITTDHLSRPGSPRRRGQQNPSLRPTNTRPCFPASINTRNNPHRRSLLFNLDKHEFGIFSEHSKLMTLWHAALGKCCWRELPLYQVASLFCVNLFDQNNVSPSN